MKYRSLKLFIFCSICLVSAVANAQVNILVAYYSRDGHTKSLAGAVAAGAASVEGSRVKLLQVAEVTTADLLDSDAVIVGSPVYNANVAPPVSAFISSWPFEGSPLKDKIGAAFVTGGGISAGEELTQMSILQSMLIFGMIIVGGPDWKTPFGASAITKEPPFEQSRQGIIDEKFSSKGYSLGRRVAEVANRFTSRE